MPHWFSPEEEAMAKKEATPLPTIDFDAAEERVIRRITVDRLRDMLIEVHALQPEDPHPDHDHYSWDLAAIEGDIRAVLEKLGGI